MMNSRLAMQKTPAATIHGFASLIGLGQFGRSLRRSRTPESASTCENM